MQEVNREKWIEVLEIVAPKRPDEAEVEWAWVMEQLELGPEYFLAIYEAVRQGGWREAESPAGYIKKVAKREKHRETPDGSRGRRGLAGMRGFQGLESAGEEITLGRGGSMEMDGERFSSEEMLDHMQYRADSGKPVREADRTWRSAPGWEADHEGLLRPAGGKPRTGKARDMMEGPGPLTPYVERIERLRRAAGMEDPYMDETPEELPDWQAWAEDAGLSEWEKKAAEYKVSGVGWTEAMAAQPDEESRRALQAAWRKLERSGRERLERAAERQGVGDQEGTGELG
jgi:hypothetical protein